MVREPENGVNGFTERQDTQDAAPNERSNSGEVRHRASMWRWGTTCYS